MKPTTQPLAKALTALTAALGTLVALYSAAAAAATPGPIPISQFPLTVSQMAHPQVVLALTNSESMDGNLSGAIMTGSGSLNASYALLQGQPSPGACNPGPTTPCPPSPVSYNIPAQFTPPLNAGPGNGTAPYTVTSGGNLADNSPSRLNVAKGGIQAILNTFMGYADFALMDYSISGGLSLYNTSVYFMSPPGGPFTFTSNPGVNRYIWNPCYNANLGALDTADSNCKNLNSFYGSSAGVATQPYMIIGASSDDANINDILYWGGGPAVCLSYNGPSPPNPYPPFFTIASYNSGSILESYSSVVNGCASATGPTNAGYVPYSPQVMYARRGWAYLSGQSSNSGQLLVSMQSAGSTPTPASVQTAINAFVPYLAPETNNTGTVEIKASTLQSPIAGILTGAKNYLNSNPPSSNGCATSRYVVLITDGLPTLDLAGRNWPPLGSVTAAGYGVTATFNTDGSLASTNDQALTDAVNTLAALKTAGIKTYIIGVGAGVDPTANPQAAATLTAMAMAGGTNNYFPATSESAVVTDMQVIMVKILAATQSTSSVAVNSTGIHNGSLAFQAQFTTADTNQDWTGNLLAFPIDASTGAVNTAPSNAIWSARPALDAFWWDSRLIATWDPVASTGIPFRWNTGSPTTGIASSTTLGQKLTTNPADTNGQDALQFLRGRKSLEWQNGGPYRPRTHTLGDIVDSSPLYVGAPAGPYQSTSYFSFETTWGNGHRPNVLYVGANDGMLHAFDAGTGNELFAYIPRGVYANLIKLTYRYYNDQHIMFVDASPQASDVQFHDGTWHTMLVGGEGAGGNSIYALDVTNPGAIVDEPTLASKVLWDFVDTDLGLTFSEPAMANTNAGFAVFFGNGYNSPQSKPFLYALDPQTGAVLRKLDLCASVPTACNLSAANGLSSVVLANTSGTLGYANVLYAGDLQGNLWRVDLTNPTPANWTATVLFQARDGSNNPQPITNTPAVSLNPLFPRVAGTMVYVGTGEMLSVQDMSNTQVQSIYGIYDSGSSATLSRTNLVQQQFGSTSSTTRTITTSSNVVYPTNKGWYLDFNLSSGERVNTNPLIENGKLIVSTNVPSFNLVSCAVGATSWLYKFDYGTGQNPKNDTTPEGQSFGNVFATTPTLDHFCPPGAPCGEMAETGLSNTQIQNTFLQGAPQQRTSWWEIR